MKRQAMIILGMFLAYGFKAYAETIPVVIDQPLSGQRDELIRLGFQLHARVGERVIGTLPATSSLLKESTGLSLLEDIADFRDVYIVDRRSLERAPVWQFSIPPIYQTDTWLLAQVDDQTLQALSQSKVHFRAVSINALPLKPRSKVEFSPLDMHPFVGIILDEVSSSSYQGYLQSLQDFDTRNTYNAQCDSVANWMRQTFQSFGLTAYLDTFQIGGYQKYNVIAELPGTAFPHQIYYIIAHYDATAGVPIMPEPTAPGADDDASGAALVLECARVLSQFDFQKTIRFAVFAGNEQGLIGSEAYVPELLQTSAEVQGVFDADMIGWSGSDPWPPDLVIYRNNDPASTILANKINEAIGLYTSAFLQPVLLADPTMIYSDHAPFWDADLPAVLAMEDEAWGDDLNPYYHSVNDLLIHLNIPYAVNALKVILAATADLALPLGTTGPSLTAANAIINDELGNHNGQIEYGEFIYLTIPVINAGGATANSVNVTLSETDPYLTLVDWQQNYGNIPALDTTSIADAFSAEVSDTVPDEHILNLTVNMSSGINTWQSPLQMVAHAPQIHILSVVVDDTTTGNGNGQLEIGETADLDVTLQNEGSYQAPNLVAALSVQDPYFNIQTSTNNYGTLAVGDSALRSYRLTVLQNAPAYFLADFILTYTATGGWTDLGSFSLNVGNIAQMPTGPDNYGYLAYEQTDLPLGPTYNWIEIDPHLGGQGTELDFTQDDQTLYVDLPFTFRYYGQDYEELSICSNGWIACGHTTSTDHTNSPLPNLDGPPDMIAPFWEDLSPQQDGVICWRFDSTAHVFIVEYNDVRDYSPTWAHNTFEVILYDPAYYPTITGDGDILIQYGPIDDASSCTVGIENHTQQIGIQILYNTFFASTVSAPLDSGKAILFTTGEDFPDVGITLTPFGTPIQIPANGGSFNFNVAVANADTVPVSFDGWCNITLPNGSLYGPVLGPIALTLPMSVSINRNRTQTVPGAAPAGTYFYNGYVGDYPDEIWEMDSFNFVKLTTGAGPPVEGWDNWGEPFELTPSSMEPPLPQEFGLGQNFPNPFNAGTVIRLSLPERSAVQVRLYNVSGQAVATLFSGVKEAGETQMYFSAAALPSGLYFYQVEATGLVLGKTYQQTRKMLVLK